MTANTQVTITIERTLLIELLRHSVELADRVLTCSFSTKAGADKIAARIRANHNFDADLYLTDADCDQLQSTI